jgi:SAM-dependent methyltransferase
MSSFDQNYSEYYNLFYEDKDYKAEAAYVGGLLTKFGRGRRVLEFGSGTGKHGLLLAEKGFDIYGIELSESMVAKAKASGYPCEVGDITSRRVSGPFDAVISLFHVLSYLTANDQIVAAFRNAALHVVPGGIFLFDVWYTPAVLSQRPETRMKRLENETCKVTRFAEPTVRSEVNVVDVRYTVMVESKRDGRMAEFQEKHAMRHFSIPEIDLICSLSGFRRILCEEFLTGNPVGEATWGACFLLEKTQDP